MASEYPILSKCLDAKWFKKHMKCPKKVALDYISTNCKFRNSFGKCESALQQIVDEIENDLNVFLQKHLSETAKNKIETMTAAAKQEADEKKAKKTAEKYGVKGPSATDLLIIEEEKEQKGKKKGKKGKNKTPDDENEEDENEDAGSRMMKVGIDEKKLSVTTTSATSDLDPKESKDELHITPRQKDLPEIHQQLLLFSKANRFVVSREGMPVENEITLKGDKINVSVMI